MATEQTYDADHLWAAAFTPLTEALGQPTIDTFLNHARPLEYDGETFSLGVPSVIAKQWLQQKHRSEIIECLSQVADEPVDLVMEVINDESDGGPVEHTRTVAAAMRDPDNQTSSLLTGTPLNPRYTFANFVVADCNRFAHAAAQQVAKSPGESYSPLFIHSKVGLGKTHLMQAIGHSVQQSEPGLNVIYLSTETFVNQVITSIREGRAEELRRLHRRGDVWLVDDMQFIASIEGPASEEEFFHTFNFLSQTNKQIVLCSDAPPRQLQIMNDRLRSRLEQGIVADLRAPTVETRVAILEKKASAEGVELRREVLEYVANKIESNIRTLEGALLKLCAYHSLYDEPLTLDSVEDIIADYSTATTDTDITLDDILEHVSTVYKIDAETIKGPKRKKEIVWPRQIAIYLSRELTDHSLAAIGDFFGGRDHSTVHHAYNKVSDMISENQDLLWKINDMRAALRREH